MRFAIGVAADNGQLTACVRTQEGVCGELSEAFDPGCAWQQGAQQAAALALRAMEASGLERADCAGTGVMIPGAVDARSGLLLYMKGSAWHCVPFAAEMQRITGLACVLGAATPYDGAKEAAALCLAQGEKEPLLLYPAFKDYLWGGRRLRYEYGKATDMTPLAESWELSCHPDGESTIGSGAWAGRTLNEYLSSHPADIGTKGQAMGEFPLLIKLIDAQSMLSIQVHPDDDYARRVENSAGKTEMWYVVDAKPGAGIYYGFKEAITRNEMAEAIRSKTLTDRLSWVEASRGDVFFIPAGTIHAIGAGLLIAEVQQSSNVTYRLWDYGRVGADGKTRPLHIDKGLDVTKREHRGPTLPYEPDRRVPGGTVRHLVNCERFCVDALEVAGLMEDTAKTDSFTALLCLEGAGAILWGEKSMQLKKGQSVFIPAGMGVYHLAGGMQVLRTRI